jgi:hypothetical protein
MSTKPKNRVPKLPPYIDPPLPDRKVVLPGGLVLTDDPAIREHALRFRLGLEDEPIELSHFVAIQHDADGNLINTYILHAPRSLTAIERVEQDIGRHFWFGNQHHIVGIPRFVPHVSYVDLRKVRKENILIT